MFIYILLKGTLVIIRKATGQKKKKKQKTLQYINAAWMERVLFMQKLTLYFVEFMEIIL